MKSKVTLLILWLITALPRVSLCQDEHLFIHHIDVGQGDATLIVSPSGKTLLVDGGNNGMGTRRVLPLIRSLHLTSLDYVVASHYDADHIGGLDEVANGLQAINVAAFDRGDPNHGETTKSYDDYVEAVKQKRKTISAGETIDLGPGIEAYCVAVNGVVYGDGSETLPQSAENDASVAIRIRYGGFDYFIGGDLTGGGRSGSKKTKDIESLAAPIIGDVDVLRVSHHGSVTSTNASLLAGLRPEVAVISVGNGGVNRSRYHHPSREVLDRLVPLVGLKSVFQTNRGETRGGLTEDDLRIIRVANGNIVLSTDGKTYLVNGASFRADEPSP